MSEITSRVYIGSDHAGYQFKEEIKKHLESKGVEFIDLGAFSEESIDYPDVAREVGEKVRENDQAKGILLCGTGIGISIAANKMRDIRCALCMTEEMAEMCRQHNNANIIAFGARTTDLETIKKMVDKFLATEFSTEERHGRRVEKMNDMSC